MGGQGSEVSALPKKFPPSLFELGRDKAPRHTGLKG